MYVFVKAPTFKLLFILFFVLKSLLVSYIASLIFQSRAHPREIMTEVLKALQEINVCWKKIGHYNMKCRWSPRFPQGHSESMLHANHSFGKELTIVEADDDVDGNLSNAVKFEIQVFFSNFS